MHNGVLSWEIQECRSHFLFIRIQKKIGKCVPWQEYSCNPISTQKLFSTPQLTTCHLTLKDPCRNKYVFVHQTHLTIKLQKLKHTYKFFSSTELWHFHGLECVNNNVLCQFTKTIRQYWRFVYSRDINFINHLRFRTVQNIIYSSHRKSSNYQRWKKMKSC